MRFGRRRFIQGCGAWACTAFVPARAWMAGGGARGPADLVLANADVWTGDPVRPGATAIAIRGSLIAGVGSLPELEKLSGPGTRIIDLGGRFAMPGLNDSHIHIARLAAQRPDVDLLGAASLAEVLARLKTRADATPPGKWIKSRAQWHEALLAESRMPTRFELDRVSEQHPIFLPRGGHVAAANSLALQLAGITDDTPDPPGGLYVRDGDGRILGVLLESARRIVARLLPALDEASYRRELRALVAELNGYGLTSATNPSTLPYDLKQLAALHEEGALSVRVHWTASIESTPAAVQELRQRHARGDGDNRLCFSGIGEAPIDGGIEGAYLREPFELVPGEQNDPTYRGIIVPAARDEDALAAFYVEAARAGLNVMIHATGDGGLDRALSACAKAARSADLRSLRWNLHGCFLVDDDQLAEIRRLGLAITAQAQPYLLGAQMQKWWGAERTARSIPIRAYIDAGITWAAGSDASAGIEVPMRSLGWMVNRRCLGGLQLDRRWGATVHEALTGYTQGSAWTQFMDHAVGVLRPGMLADIAVFASSPFKVNPAEIGELQADATLLDGRPVFDRHGLFR